MLFGAHRAAVAPAEDPAQVHAAAARGTATPATTLPYADQIQRAFGRHDISKIQAHVGVEAAASAREMAARGYATGNHVVLGEGADLHTVAHEAAHVVQQRHGVQLEGGVGDAGDEYERHADAVATRAVVGQSAQDLLDSSSPGASAQASGLIQRKILNPGGGLFTDVDEVENALGFKLSGSQREAVQGMLDEHVEPGYTLEQVRKRVAGDKEKREKQPDWGEKEPDREKSVTDHTQDGGPSVPITTVPMGSGVVEIGTDEFIYIVNGNATKKVNEKFSTPGEIRYVKTDGVADCIAFALQGVRRCDGITVSGFFHLSSHQYSGRLPISGDAAQAAQDEEYENKRDRNSAATLYRMKEFLLATELTKSKGITSRASGALVDLLDGIPIQNLGILEADVVFDSHDLDIEVTRRETEKPSNKPIGNSRQLAELTHQALRLPERTRRERETKIRRLNEILIKMEWNDKSWAKGKCIDNRARLQKVDATCSLF